MTFHQWGRWALMGLLGLFTLKPSFTMAADYGYGFYGRIDLISVDQGSKSLKTANDEGQYTKFRTWYPGLNFWAHLAPNIKFNFDMYVQTMVANNDELANNVNLFNIEYSFSESSVLTVGKMWYAAVGAWENDQAVVDVYKYSLANDLYFAPSYQIGAMWSQTFAKQTVRIAVINPNFSATADQAFDYDGNATVATGEGQVQNQKNLGYALSYYGNFMDGKLLPIFSFISLGTTEQKDATGTKVFDAVQKNYLSVGVKYDTELFNIMVDHLNHSLPDQTAGSSADLTVISNVFQLKYKLSKWVPFLKVWHDHYKQDGSPDEEYSRMAYMGGLEYNDTEHLRFYAAFNQIEADYKTNVKRDYTDTIAMIGMTFNYKSK